MKTKPRKFSPAQLAAQARFAKAAKAGTLRRKKRNTTIIKAKKISHLDVSKVHNGLASAKKRPIAKRNASVSTKLYSQLLKAENAYGRLADKFGPMSKQAEKAWKLVNTISERIKTDQLKQNGLAASKKRKPATTTVKSSKPNGDFLKMAEWEARIKKTSTYKNWEKALAEAEQLQTLAAWQKVKKADERLQRLLAWRPKVKKNPRGGKRGTKTTASVRRQPPKHLTPADKARKQKFQSAMVKSAIYLKRETIPNLKSAVQRIKHDLSKLPAGAEKNLAKASLTHHKAVLKKAESELRSYFRKIKPSRYINPKSGRRLVSNAARRRNGANTSLARQRRSEFVGRPSTQMKTLYAPAGSGAKGTLSQLGKLHKISVKGGKVYNFLGVPTLAQHPKTDQLFVLGKNYIVKVPKKNPGDRMVDLGEVTRIEYEAVKTHLGDTKPVTYYHHFGEEGGKRPHALVNEEGLIIFSGGDYYIRPEGIRD